MVQSLFFVFVVKFFCFLVVAFVPIGVGGGWYFCTCYFVHFLVVVPMCEICSLLDLLMLHVPCAGLKLAGSSARWMCVDRG